MDDTFRYHMCYLYPVGHVVYVDCCRFVLKICPLRVFPCLYSCWGISDHAVTFHLCTLEFRTSVIICFATYLEVLLNIDRVE
eukprot:SAG11_NODE_399_length_9764_cov_8.760993_5_plen_82_part_00